MKAFIAFNYLNQNCKYATRGWQYNGANTAWGALVYGEAQCSGYARGMKALCDAIEYHVIMFMPIKGIKSKPSMEPGESGWKMVYCRCSERIFSGRQQNLEK